MCNLNPSIYIYIYIKDWSLKASITKSRDYYIYNCNTSAAPSRPPRGAKKKKVIIQKLLFKCKIEELNWIQDSPHTHTTLDINRAECYYAVKLLAKPKVLFFFQYINLLAENDYDNMSRVLTNDSLL